MQNCGNMDEIYSISHSLDENSAIFFILYRGRSLKELFDLQSQMGPAEKEIENSFKTSWLSSAARASCPRLSRGFSAVLPVSVHCPRRRHRSATSWIL